MSSSSLSIREKSPLVGGQQPLSVDQLQDQKHRLEEENTLLKKQLRTKEADFSKIKAVLEQKVQLLEMQVQDALEREDNLKKVQDKMFNAFNTEKSDGGKMHPEMAKELQVTNEMYQSEIEEIKQHHLKISQSLERQIQEQKQIIDIQEQKLKTFDDKLSKKQYELDHGRMEAQLKHKEQEMRIKQLEDENNRLQSDIEHEKQQMKLKLEFVANEQKKQLNNSMSSNSNFNSKKGYQKREFDSEIERIKKSQDQVLQSMKHNFEKEKQLMEAQIHKLEQDVKISKLKNENNTKINISDIQNRYLKEIQELNASLTQFKKQTEEEIVQAKKEKEEAIKRSETLDKDLCILKSKYKKSQDELKSSKEQHSISIDHQNNEKDKKEEISKQKKKIQVLQLQVQKLENIERKMKNMLIEKETEHEQEVMELKRAINMEKKKARDLQDTSINFKHTYDQIQDDILQQVKEKDEKIFIMDKTIKNLQKTVKDSQQQQQQAENKLLLKTAATNKMYMDYSPEAHKEQQQQQDCYMLPMETQQSVLLATKILEMGQEITCSGCSEKMNIKKFVKHIQHSPCAYDETTNTIDNLMAYEEDKDHTMMKKVLNSYLNTNLCIDESKLNQIFDSNVSSVQFFQSSCAEEPADSYYSQKDKNENATASNRTIEQLKNKLDQQEKIINNLNAQVEELQQDKDRLQIEYDKVVLELKRTKIELALSDERKQESEQCYKNEIKYLIDKLLKTKTKLNKERQDRDEERHNASTTSFISQSTMNYLNQMKCKVSEIDSGANASNMVDLDLSMDLRNSQFLKRGSKNSNSTSRLYGKTNNQTAVHANRARILKELEQNAQMNITKAAKQEQSLLQNFNQTYEQLINNRSQNCKSQLTMNTTKRPPSSTSNHMIKHQNSSKNLRASGSGTGLQGQKAKLDFLVRQQYKFNQSSDEGENCSPPQMMFNKWEKQ